MRELKLENCLGLNGSSFSKDYFPKYILDRLIDGDRIFSNNGIELIYNNNTFKLITYNVNNYIIKEDIEKSAWNLVL